ncbi:FAS1 domain-containing protein [Scenedesmus sp. NREL 46B-D3]|nr:FAS1 domain-containing protein [Scenedesmus sp. NREL 46B-D3]
MKRFVVAGLVLLLAGACAAKPLHGDAHATTESQPDESHSQGWNSHIDSAYSPDAIMASFLDMVRSMFVSDEPAAKTVAELADNAPGNVSMLVNGVKRADLQAVIGDPNWEATIFCPSNKAFRAALLKLKIKITDLYTDKTALLNILSYHTVPGTALSAADLKDGQELTTASQHKLTVHVDKVAGTSIAGASDTGTVVAADIRAGKAIVHVIDEVLLPPKPTAEL